MPITNAGATTDPEASFCESCGASNKSAARFCRKCGAGLVVPEATRRHDGVESAEAKAPALEQAAPTPLHFTVATFLVWALAIAQIAALGILCIVPVELSQRFGQAVLDSIHMPRLYTWHGVEAILFCSYVILLVGVVNLRGVDAIRKRAIAGYAVAVLISGLLDYEIYANERHSYVWRIVGALLIAALMSACLALLSVTPVLRRVISSQSQLSQRVMTSDQSGPIGKPSILAPLGRRWVWVAGGVGLCLVLVASVWIAGRTAERSRPGVQTGEQVQGPFRTFPGFGDWVLSVAFSPDGQLLASSSQDGSIRLLNLTTGEPPRVLTEGSFLRGTITFSPDGRILAADSHDSNIRFWSVTTGQSLRMLTGHGSWVLSLAFSPTGRILASGSGDKTIRLWDVGTGETMHTLVGHTDAVARVAFSPDGRMVASAGRDGTVRLWNTATGQLMWTLTVYASPFPVHAVAFSPDGRVLASEGTENSVRLWNVATGGALRNLPGHSHFVYALAFSPNGKFLASGSADKTIRLWDLATNQTRRLLVGHAGTVSSLAFSPDGRQLASGGYDKTVRLWSIE